MNYPTLNEDVYGANAAASDRPYLARIADLAGEAALIGDYVENFIDRCRGGGAGAQCAPGTAPLPTGYLAALDRLQENLGRVDRLARELQTIG